jgi:23S rRNA (cytosine1962-C5)-methyltransferase
MSLPRIFTEAIERRQGLLAMEPCVRLLHLDDPTLRCDRFGQVCWGYWYSEEDPSPQLHEELDDLSRIAGADHWHLHGMSDRGRDPNRRRHWSSAEAPVSWQATEDDLQFILRSDRGQSPGLFLDQRDNRRWVRKNSAGRRVANLFSYTGAFGVAAACGGATHVEQIDVSRPYLDWSSQNAQMNAVDEVMAHTAVDAQLFLSGCQKRSRPFDAIICDPPSFARGRRGRPAWQVIDHLPGLVQRALELLTPDGWLLVTSNHEGWSREQMRNALKGLGSKRIEAAAEPGKDFEYDGEESRLKGFVLWR